MPLNSITKTPWGRKISTINKINQHIKHLNIKCFCRHQKSWFIWDGIKWECDKSGSIPLLAKETVRSILIDASNPALDKKEAKGLGSKPGNT